MSWSFFIFAVVGMVALLVLLVALPWLIRSKATQKHTLTNTQVIGQRLQELQTEFEQGLLTESDLHQASDEAKIALVDETQTQVNTASSGRLPVVIGGIVALVVGLTVYWQVNNLEKLDQKVTAIASLSQLSEKLAQGADSNITAEDVQNLTLAIRSRLRSEPEDAQGWMFLGRLWMAIGQQEQSFDSFKKALKLDPNNTNIQMSYAQALMVSSQRGDLQLAQNILFNLVQEFPENDNLALMMALVSAQLGDLENTQRYFAQVKAKLSADSPVYQQITALIDELSGTEDDANEVASLTGFSVTIDIDDSLRQKLPENGTLFVFAQDANSENRMPAAVIRMPLSELPTAVKLTTDNAMTPAFTLAQLSNVKLVARISSSNGAMPVAGDLEGSIEVVVQQGQMTSQSISIDEEIM
jgi:cytochrome c-type biogenesis protein CcmI